MPLPWQGSQLSGQPLPETTPPSSCYHHDNDNDNDDDDDIAEDDYENSLFCRASKNLFWQNWKVLHSQK